MATAVKQLDEAAIMAVLERVPDPEIPVLSILDLGIVRGVADDDPRVNPNGGAIALGHPLGMSGARLALTATEELQRGAGKLALATMCIGVGQGIALALERV